MTDRELLQQSLNVLRHLCLHSRAVKGYDGEQVQAGIDALRAQLAQPEPEPVAWRRSNWSGSDDNYVYRDYDDPLLNTKGENVGEPLYTAPPKREWVGLTDDEIEGAIDEGFAFGLDDGNVSNKYVIRYVRVIEALLKEKNCG